MSIEAVGPLESFEAIQEASVGYQATLQSLQREITERCTKLEKLQTSLDAVMRSSASSLEDVQRSIREMEEEDTSLLSSMVYSIVFDQPSTAQSAYEACKVSLEEIFTQLTQCPRRDYTRESLHALQQQLPATKERGARAELYEAQLFATKQSLEANKRKGAIECPSCTHSWHPNYSDAEYLKVSRQHEEAMTVTKSIKQILDKLLADIEEHLHFFSLIDRYHQLTQHFSILQPYWSFIQSTEKLLKDPDSLLAMSNHFSSQ